MTHKKNPASVGTLDRADSVEQANSAQHIEVQRVTPACYPFEIKSFKARDKWIRALIADKAISPITRLIGVRLAHYHNCATGQCNPAYASLAVDVGGISARSAMRAVAALELRGWLAVYRSGGGHQSNTNSFHLLAERMTAVSRLGVTVASPVKFSGVTLVTPRGDSGCQLGVTELCHPNSERENSEENSEGDSITLQPSDLSDSDAVIESSAAYLKKEDAFADFWSVFPRKVAKAKAQRAFAKAIKSGADPGTIVAGARRYGAERAAQEVKYTAHPTTWLTDQRWMDEAAPVTGGQVIDQHGNAIPMARPPAHQRAQKRWSDYADSIEEGDDNE